MKDICSHLLSDKWYADRKSDTVEESKRIIRLAGKIIAAGIRDLPISTDAYPSFDDVTSSLSDPNNENWIPNLLRVFLQELISSTTKVNASGQSIVQCARPRTSLLPLPVALAVSIDNVCGTSRLITEISRLGFCSTYDELRRFKLSAVRARTSDQEHHSSNNTDLNKHHTSMLTQYVAGNVDHDIQTIGGRNIFHGMGIIDVTNHHVMSFI